ncbi:MAG: acyl carrier protein [Gordonia sp. (in: high G+C Gram-positive bacteria)]
MTQQDSQVSTTITVEEVCAIVSAAIARRSGRAETVEPDTEVLLTGLLDSLTLVNIVAELEERVGQRLPENLVVARNFRTPTTLHAAVGDALGVQSR